MEDKEWDWKVASKVRESEEADSKVALWCSFVESGRDARKEITLSTVNEVISSSRISN